MRKLGYFLLAASLVVVLIAPWFSNLGTADILALNAVTFFGFAVAALSQQ